MVAHDEEGFVLLVALAEAGIGGEREVRCGERSVQTAGEIARPQFPATRLSRLLARAC